MRAATVTLLLTLLAAAMVDAQRLSASVISVQGDLPPVVNENVVFGGEDGTSTTDAARRTTEEAVNASQEEEESAITSSPPSVIPKRPACKADTECGRPGKAYCDRHYGTCHVCVRETHLCRKTSTCCRGMECSYGRCRMPVKPGRLGSRCKADRDCNGDTCCARHWGQDVCKATLRLNDRCEPANGGLMWSIHSHCHCAAGLYCREQLEFYRLQIGWYTLTFPFSIRTSRCRRRNAMSQTTAIQPTPMF